MSVLTRKCDFYDSVNIAENIEEYLGNNAEIYVGDIRIPNETEKDIALYYPFLVSTAFRSDERNVIHLSRYSHIDYKEYDILTDMLNDVFKYYNKCKRDKTDFTFEGFQNSKYYNVFVDGDIYKELYDRVQKNGKKANILGLSSPYYDKYSRPRFYDLLIEHGYNEQFAYNWVYNRKTQLWYERHKENYIEHIEDEEVEKHIRQCINQLKLNHDQYVTYSHCGDMFVLVHRLEDDGEYYVIVSRNTDDCHIKFNDDEYVD